ITGYGQVYVFERSRFREPKIAMLPVAARGGGISSAEWLGILRWDPAAKTIVSTMVSDICTDMLLRHTYRHGSGDMNGFALIKIERGNTCVREEDMNLTTIWEAKPWDFQPN